MPPDNINNPPHENPSFEEMRRRMGELADAALDDAFDADLEQARLQALHEVEETPILPLPTAPPNSEWQSAQNAMNDIVRIRGTRNFTGAQFSPAATEFASEFVEIDEPAHERSLIEEVTFANEEALNEAALRDPSLLHGSSVAVNLDGTYVVTRRRTPPTMMYSRSTFGSFGLGSYPPSNDSLSKAALTRLTKAMNTLDSDKQRRMQQMQQLRGRREGQYIKLLRNEKRRNMTYIEIVGSEIPIKISELGWNKVRNVLDTIRLSEVKKTDGNYEMHCAEHTCKLEKLPYEFGYFCNNHLWCAEHVPDLKLCELCLELAGTSKVIKTFDEKLINVCAHCTERLHRYDCRGCGDVVPVEYVQVRICPKCMERNNGPRNGQTRAFSRGLKWTGKEVGDMVKSSRVYSVEIESLSPFPDHANKLSKLLPPEIGIATDGSVTANDGKAYGYELQTPRLSGRRGEELVQRMCAATKEVESQVNESCGMHVHIDGQGLIPLDRKEYPAALIQMWKAYLVFEDVLMSLVPYSRRNNDFCRRLSESFQINELDTIENMLDVEKMWYKSRTSQDIRNAKTQHYSPTRYFGVNFHCLLNDGHFEIRFHPGTLLPKKILEWANLHILITDAAVRLAFTQDFLKEAQATYLLSEKTQLLFDLIGMSKPSKEFYLSRQRKFADKKHREDETKNNGDMHRGNALMTEEN